MNITVTEGAVCRLQSAYLDEMRKWTFSDRGYGELRQFLAIRDELPALGLGDATVSMDRDIYSFRTRSDATLFVQNKAFEVALTALLSDPELPDLLPMQMEADLNGF